MVSPIEQSLLPLTAEVSSNGHLVLGGCDVITLAEEYGTPLFIYDEEHLRIRCREAVRAFGPGVAYATKAFLCTAMARVALEEGMCLDVATAGELYSALRAGAQGNQIVLHGNNKSEAEILLALETGVRLIIIDSEDEIDRLERLVSAELQATVLLRVTPGVEAHTHEFIKTGQEDSKFGFSIASGAAQRAVTRLEAMKHVDLAGIHAHIGSQVFDVDSFAQASEILASFFVPLGLRELCVGDLVATPVTGAYGYSMASTYNKVPRPPVIFVRGGKATVVVRRETVEDLGALDA